MIAITVIIFDRPLAQVADIKCLPLRRRAVARGSIYAGLRRQPARAMNLTAVSQICSMAATAPS